MSEQLVAGPVGEVFAFFAPARDLERIFDHRRAEARRLLDERRTG